MRAGWSAGCKAGRYLAGGTCQQVTALEQPFVWGQDVALEAPLWQVAYLQGINLSNNWGLNWPWDINSFCHFLWPMSFTLAFFLHIFQRICAGLGPGRCIRGAGRRGKDSHFLSSCGQTWCYFNYQNHGPVASSNEPKVIQLQRKGMHIQCLLLWRIILPYGRCSVSSLLHCGPRSHPLSPHGTVREQRQGFITSSLTWKLSTVRTSGEDGPRWQMTLLELGQKIPDWLIKTMFLGEAETEIRSGMRSRFATMGFEHKQPLWFSLSHQFLPFLGKFISSQPVEKSWFK